MANSDIYKKISSELKYNGLIMDVYVDKIEFPNGEEHYREIIKKRSASAVLPIGDNGDIILVRQYRHPIGKMSLEIPAGLSEPNENPIETAKRELEEEIGFLPKKIDFICKTHGSIGFSDESIHIYIAKDLQKTKQNFDYGEVIHIEIYSLSECLNMIYLGKITDSKTIIAILHYNNILRKEL